MDPQLPTTLLGLWRPGHCIDADGFIPSIQPTTDCEGVEKGQGQDEQDQRGSDDDVDDDNGNDDDDNDE